MLASHNFFMNRTQKGDSHEKDRIAFHSLSVDYRAFYQTEVSLRTIHSGVYPKVRKCDSEKGG